MALCCRSFWLQSPPSGKKITNHQDEARPCFPLRRLCRRLLCCEFRSVAMCCSAAEFSLRELLIGQWTGRRRTADGIIACYRAVLKKCRYQARYRSQACLEGWNVHIWMTSAGGRDCSIHLVLGRDGARMMLTGTRATCGVLEKTGIILPTPYSYHSWNDK